MNKDFMTGCNYWASHAGTEMWNRWDENIVRSDFAKLREYGVTHMRVFPIWRDFQPIYAYCGHRGAVEGYRLPNDSLPRNPYYLDEGMLEKFDTFCDIAEEFGIKLVVGILTGWMSGRCFLPPALSGKNLASDPVALLFEQKYASGIVRRFKHKTAICAWDLGNECNQLVKAESRFEAECWTAVISNAIKAEDTTRPLVSGMDSIGTEGIWRIEDQAQYTDILTSHPYPYWLEHSKEAETSSIQTLMHATCLTKYYSEIGNKPCLTEEIGTMGPMVCDDEIAGNFLRVNLYSNWANGSQGVMWWCANEQISLMFPPYDCNMVEVELGMFDKYGNAKPVAEEVRNFSEWLKTAPELPPAVYDAVCLSTASQDQWGNSYAAYVLAKQAGANIRFADALKKIPEAEIYLMPGVNGNYVLPAQNYADLKERVKNGATLYISIDDGILSDFAELTGVKVIGTRTKTDSGEFTVCNETVRYSRERNYIIRAEKAEVMAEDENGIPIFTKNAYGKGFVYFLNFPLEKNTLGICDAFDNSQNAVYKKIFGSVKEKSFVTFSNKYIGATYHRGDTGEWVTMINYSPYPQKTDIKARDGVEYSTVKGNPNVIEPFEMTILEIKKK